MSGDQLSTNTTQTDDVPSVDDLFPSFDGPVTHILRDFLNLHSEENDIICEALCYAGCNTWTEFQFLNADLISCLDYENGGQRVPLSPGHVLRLNTLAAYMAHLNDTIGATASLDLSNYDPADFAVFRVTQPRNTAASSSSSIPPQHSPPTNSTTTSRFTKTDEQVKYEHWIKRSHDVTVFDVLKNDNRFETWLTGFRAQLAADKRRQASSQPAGSSSGSGSIQRRLPLLLVALSTLTILNIAFTTRQVLSVQSVEYWYKSSIDNSPPSFESSSSEIPRPGKGTRREAGMETNTESSQRTESIAEPTETGAATTPLEKAPSMKATTETAATAASTGKEESLEKASVSIPAEPFSRSVRTSPRVPSQASSDYYDRLKLASVDNLFGGSNETRTGSGSGFVMYTSCCGLGHRLSRQAGAVRGAWEDGYPHLWIHWTKKHRDSCGSFRQKGHLDIFERFFGPGPVLFLDDAQADGDPDLNHYSIAAEAATTTMEKHLPNATLEAALDEIQINNSKERFTKQNIRSLPNGYPNFSPPCFWRISRPQLQQLAVADERFYRQLRSTFRHNDRIRSFVEQHGFADRIVVGTHIRAGNGETGDFQQKSRGIENLDSFLNNMAETIHRLVRSMQSARSLSEAAKLKPLVFLATDDPAVFDILSRGLRPFGLEVVSFPQAQMERGKGVSFRKKEFKDNEQCQENWISQIIDSMVLGMADAIVCARYSSFTQTLPAMALFSDSIRAQHRQGWWRPGHATRILDKELQLVRDDHNPRFANRLFCEADGDGTGMKCFDDFVDWALNANVLLVGDQLSLTGVTHEITLVDACRPKSPTTTTTAAAATATATTNT